MTRTIASPRLARRHGLRVGLGLGLGGLAGAWLEPARARSAAAAPAVGELAPDFTLRTTDGRAMRLAEQRGQVVMINFWASWCAPCRVEMPHLQRLHEQYRAAGFLLLGVSVDDDAARAVQAAQRAGVTFAVLLDTDKSVSARYDLRTMPSTVLVDRDGRLRHVHRGWRDGLEQVYAQQLRALVKDS